jgi:hypothetical protein
MALGARASVGSKTYPTLPSDPLTRTISPALALAARAMMSWRVIGSVEELVAMSMEALVLRGRRRCGRMGRRVGMR